MKVIRAVFLILVFLSIKSLVSGQIKRIWLTHRTNDPSHLVINWQSKEPGNSEVRFSIGNGRERRITEKGETTLHHIEIPLVKKNLMYHYRVITGKEKSETFTFKGYPSSRYEFRAAVVGNCGYADNPDLTQLLRDNPHLLLTLGDNIPNLHDLCESGTKDCIEPFLKLIDSAPGLFQTTPFLPILGNHDKEIRSRGNKYPPEAVYDTNATAYRKFFELPDDEWKWHFFIPDFDICFIALDLNHISDFGTTWQTCHDFHYGSEQIEWYRMIQKNNSMKYKITLLNERNQSMRSQENYEWQNLFQQGTAVISGFGYYSERAEVDGFPYFNTSLKTGDKYPDKFSKALYDVNGYILLSLTKNTLKIDMKTLQGKTIDSTFW